MSKWALILNNRVAGVRDRPLLFLENVELWRRQQGPGHNSSAVQQNCPLQGLNSALWWEKSPCPRKGGWVAGKAPAGCCSLPVSEPAS